MGIVERNVEQIRADPVLLRYGAILAAVELLTVCWAWGQVPLLLPGKAALCWPFWQSCEAARVLAAPALQAWLLVLAALAIGASACFLRGRARGGWCLLALATGGKVAFVLLDYRLRANQHYVACAVIATFLFWPHKRDALRVLLVSIYFWAGTLKLDSEWLSGSTLYRPIWLLRGPALVVACSYVVLLELVLVWGALARHRWWFWATLFQLAIFHLFSWPVVGYFYPVLMALLLALFPLAWLDPRGEASLLERFTRCRSDGATYALFALFAALQLLPGLLLPGDSAITGEGRFLKLHMFDSLTVCEAEIELHRPDGRVSRLPSPPLEPRIHCDPWVLYSRAQHVCRRTEKRGLSLRVDLRLRSRRSNEAELRTVVDEADLCRRGLRYDWWRHNDWIRLRPSRRHGELARGTSP
jgi:hypothetical protein